MENCKKSEIKYVLITPAKNEEKYIRKTLESVVSQTIPPIKWIVVDDGSKDDTSKIVEEYERKYNFIKLMHRKSDIHRSFESKVFAIRAGENLLNNIEYDYIGNLDADISFESSYYEMIFNKFKENPKLGIGGGIIHENYNGEWVQLFITPSLSVNGAVQLFRKQCYKNVGGYIPLSKGGVDKIAETMARMHDWEVKSFSDITVYHHRNMGTGNGNILTAKFRLGIQEYSHRNHPFFEMIKCAYRIKERPYLFASISRFAGYTWSFLKRDQKCIPDDVIKFMRNEQMQRLHNTFCFWKEMV